MIKIQIKSVISERRDAADHDHDKKKYEQNFYFKK